MSVNRLSLVFAFLIALCLFPQIHYAHALNVNQNSSSSIITVSDPALQTQVVSLDLCVYSVEIYNAAGLKLYNHQFISDQVVFKLQLDTSPFESGMYFMRTIFSDESSTIHRFAKL